MIVPTHPPNEYQLPATVDRAPLALEFVHLGVLRLALLKERGHGPDSVHDGQCFEIESLLPERTKERVASEGDPEPASSHPPMLRHAPRPAFH